MVLPNDRKTGNTRPRVLFFAESLTLCHITRPLVLAQGLDRQIYDVHVACNEQYHHLYRDACEQLHHLNSVPTEKSLERVAKGQPVFDTTTLRRYVKEDLQLIERIQPDVVVGDMRLSLAVSAPVAKVCYMAIVNAYWSPYAKQKYVVPELPISRALGPVAANLVFQILKPLAFSSHCAPLNAVRKEYGLKPLGRDLRDVYTFADVVLYPDPPDLITTYNLPSNHHYLGAILWSYPAPLPEWWESLPDDRPVVYVSLGSSGRPDLLDVVLDGLETLPVTVIAATSGRSNARTNGKNIFVCKYLPAIEASQRARLLISHGGSAPAYVALSVGTPILGIPSNMDQYLTNHYVKVSRLGDYIRSESATGQRIKRLAEKMLGDEPLHQNVEAWADRRKNSNLPTQEFNACLEKTVGGHALPRSG